MRALFLRRKPGTGNRSGRGYYFTSLTPILAGREGALAAHLDGLGTGPDSPLARVASVHFGRWLIIERLRLDYPGAPRRPTRLRSKYLFFSACITASVDGASADDLPGAFLRDLAAQIPSEADAIWGHCVGYPGSAAVDEFVGYLTRSQLDTMLFYQGYPNATVHQVHRALARHDALVEFVRHHQDEEDPVRLQQAYLEESATWWP